MDKIKELGEELKTVFSGRGTRILDSILPVLIFMGVRSLAGLKVALGAAAGIALVIFLVRIVKKSNFYFALGGLGVVLIAGGIALISGSEAGFYLPGLLSGGLTVLLCLLSVIIKRPLAAWSSHLTRRWPQEWYWHDRVRPAYAEVTLFWLIGFGARSGLELWFFSQGETASLGVIRTFLGWPYTIVLLILSYLYGVWRLGNLAGPSVEDFKTGSAGPWEGQKRGF